MLTWKLAAHAHDRIEERSSLPRTLVDDAQKRLELLPPDKTPSYHWTARSGDQVLGHLVVKRVGEEQKPVVATFLKPKMKPPGPELTAHLGPLLPAEKAAEGGKAKVFSGLKVRIDRPKGFVQHGKDAQGKPWKRVYKVDYGYLPGTEGGDGEGLDVFFGPDEQAETAYLVRQNKDDGSFDEFKLMLGFASKSAALSCYDDHIPRKLRGETKEVPVSVLRMMTGQAPALAKVAEAFVGSLLGAEKVAAPRWIKVLQQGGDAAEEVRKRMPLSDDLRQAIAAAPKGGLLTSLRLPKPGLAQEGVDAASAQPMFKDPLLNLDTIVDMQTRDPKGRAQHTKSLRDHLNVDGLGYRKAVRDISDADRLALNTHPNLLDADRWKRDEAKRFGEGAELLDALQTGSNPAIEVQALMDPSFGAALEDRVRAPYRLRAQRAKPSETRPYGDDVAGPLFDEKKKQLMQGQRPPSVTSMKQELIPESFDSWDRPREVEIAAHNRRNRRETVGGLRAWRDLQGENPGQLNFGIVPPDVERVGAYGARQRENAAHELERAGDLAAHEAEMARLRGLGTVRQRSLFFEGADGGIDYAHYPRTKSDVERLQKYEAFRGREKNVGVGDLAPPKSEVAQPQPVAEPPKSRSIAPLVMGGAALAGGALGVRHILKRRAEAAEGSSELPGIREGWTAYPLSTQAPSTTPSSAPPRRSRSWSACLCGSAPTTP